MKNYIHTCWILLGWFVHGSVTFAQGSAVVLPMSKYVLKQEDRISFQVHNQLNSHMMMDVNYRCEVDGEDLDGDICMKYFTVKFGSEMNLKKIEIPQLSSVRGEVSLQLPVKRFALFKPIFTPMTTHEKKTEGVAFDFSYQPGYIFLVSPEPANLSLPKFTVRSTNTEQVAIFDFDIAEMVTPAIASISAKIIDKENKKMMRFTRLASEKIIDPRRKTLRLEAGYAPPGDKTFACYELLVQWVSDKRIQKITNCNQ